MVDHERDAAARTLTAAEEQTTPRRRPQLSRPSASPRFAPPGGELWRWLARVVPVLLSLALLISSMGLDGYLQRGVVWGLPNSNAEPVTGGQILGANVFLEKEVNRDNIVTTIEMLRDARITFVRQTFSWAEIEPAPGRYINPKTGEDSWAKYDFIVSQLYAAGIGILARIDTIPQWARPPSDDVARWDKGPPQDFNNYANFAGVLTERYLGKVGHVQVWNEPNLQGEWGGKPIDPAQYALLLKFTYPKIKAANPAALVVTAGLAQTIEQGPENLNELAFIQGLYDAGANKEFAAFDVLSVMGYGLGDSPEDRRVGPRRTNFSRLLLAREVMVRNGDAAKPIWASEYGWLSLPPDWQGPTGGWGASVSADTQARYTIAGLERARREWPWLGAVFIWAFRWVEPPSERPTDPSRYFEIVDYDFAPRPTYIALRDWSQTQAIATAGLLGVRDARLDYRGAWRDQEVAGRAYRVVEAPGGALRLTFHGADVVLRARTGPRAGRVYVTIDGAPVPKLQRDAQGTYISLRNSEVIDDSLPIARGLTDTTHILELRAAGDSQLAIAGLTIGRRQPFAWVAPFLFTSSLAGVVASVLLLLRAVARPIGWLPPAGMIRPRARGLAWWDTRE